MVADLYNKYKALLLEHETLKAELELLGDSGETHSNEFAQVLDAINAGVVVHSNYKIKYANNTACEILGATAPKDLRDKLIFDILPPEVHSLANIRISKAKQGIRLPAAESELVRVDTQEKVPVLVSVSSVELFNQTAIATVFIDLRESKSNYSQLTHLRKMLESINKIQDIEAVNEEEFIREILEEAVSITKSEVGFFVFVNEDQNSLKLGIWSENTKHFCNAIYENHYPIDNAGIWADCLRSNKPVMVNNYAMAEHKKGLPEGHFPLLRFLSIPIFEDDKKVAVLAVGNKGENYNEDDINELTVFCNHLWNAVHKLRMQKSIARSEEFLRTVVTNLPNTLIAIINRQDKVEMLTGAEDNIQLLKLRLAIESSGIAEELPTEDLERLNDAKDKALSGTNSSIEIEFEHRNLVIYISPIVIESLAVDSLLIVFRDITDYKQLESKQQESEEKYKLLVENSNDGIMIVAEQRIIFANKKMSRITGTQEGSLEDTDFLSLYPASEQSKNIDYYNRKRKNQYIPNAFETVLNGKHRALPIEQTLSIIKFRGIEALLITVRDISERIKSRSILNRMSLISEQSPNSILITNRNGIIEYVNNSFEHISGYSKEEIYGKTPSILKSGKTNDKVYKDMWENLNLGNKWEGELLNRKKNGELFWEKNIIFSIKDDLGEITHFIAIKEDITEKKTAEQKLIQTNKLLKMLNDCYIALLNCDTDKELFYSFCDIAINAGASTALIIENIEVSDNHIDSMLLAYAMKERADIELHEGMDISIGISNCQLAMGIANKKIAYCMNTNCGSACSKLFIKESPTEFSITLPIENENYNNLQIVIIGVGNDNMDEQSSLFQELVNYLNFGLDTIFEKISRLKAEELHLVEKEQLDTTLSSIGDGVLTIDRDNKIVYINRAGLKILDKTSEECLNRSFFETIELYDQSDNIVLYNPYDYLHVKIDDPLAKTRFVVKRHNGKVRYINITVNKILDTNNAFIGIVVVLKDITKIVKIETQSALSQKMESVGQLASGIANEINTPMQFIGDNTFFTQESFVQMIDFVNNIKNYDYDNFDASEFKKYLDEQLEINDIEYLASEVPVALNRTLEGIDRVRSIITAMKSFAHSSGRTKSKANINQGLEVTASITKNEWKYVADVEMKLDNTLPLVYCSIDELNQVALNMIVNAAHAIKERANNEEDFKGKIVVETKFDYDYAYIFISDNGSGIPPEKIGRIFDPFYTTKEIGQGTGQGLAIAHDIVVKKHKGFIEVESELGKGTQFIIKIPLSEL